MYSRELNLYFPFIDEEFMFATQPSRYISHLIGHEGPGSIMSYIRSKGWANGLNAGAYPMCPGTPSIFDMQVCLTEDGLKNYPEIIDIFFLYIALLQYRHDKIPDDLMQECKKAFAVSPQDRLPTLHLPHKNQFIPNKPEVEKQEMDEQALNPRVLRNDGIARTQWKKDDIFWVPRANVIVNLKTPLFYASTENNVKARLFSDLVRDALEMYSYDAELAGLQYKVSLDSRGMFLDVSGYNDKLPVLLDQIVTTMRDLDINKYRFETVKQRLTRGYNWQLQSSYHQVGDYTNWLNAPERDFIVEELAAELSGVTWRILRGPAFDQLRTKEPFGYIVFSKPRTFSMTYGFRFLIQSEMALEFLDSRSEAFLVRYADILETMNDTEFEGPKRSLIVWRRRDRLSIHLQAQGKAEGVDKRQEEVQKNANMETSAGDDVKMAEEITDGRLFKAGLTASLGARPVKDISEYEDTDAELWGGGCVTLLPGFLLG
ncbi:hypothetical protein BFJ68_g16763 [Fusarium oxysporum]|uniref:Uncharacterized protein n=1 Tax=Fusarium oxysporum TaxID=5507 RepID=A0A420P9H6_FUSOX|nr:hypothetical protein BFJ68_g16763 [Fusarium oxysporum]